MTIQAWLENRLSRKAMACAATSVLAMLAGLVVVFITFWLVFGVICFVFAWWLPLSPRICLALSGAVIVLLFIGNYRTDWRYLEDTSFVDLPEELRGDPGTAGEWEELPLIALPLLGTVMAVRSLEFGHSCVKVITSSLYFGPRLCTQSVRLVRQAIRMPGMDTTACAAVIAFLLERDHGVTFQELAKAIPPGHNAVTVMTQLRLIDGIIFVDSEPPGVALSSDVREELEQAV